MTKIIADACCNHMGDRRIMETMIRSASLAGADLIKFQSFKADMLRKDWPDYENEHAYYKQHEISEDDHAWLIEKCEKNKIEFLTTVFDMDTVDFLKGLGVSKVKIASPDMMNWKLIDKCLDSFQEVIISTGLHTSPERAELLERIKPDKDRVVVLHCVSEYPAALMDVNMRYAVIDGYRWGFSDHTTGTHACKVAIALGAEYIEKHYTLNRSLPGKDQKVAGTFEEILDIFNWNNLVSGILGDKTRRLTKKEIENRKKYIGRWSGA